MTNEPRFVVLDHSDPEYQATIRAARESLGDFRDLIAECEGSGASPCVKTTLVDGDEKAPIWLMDARVEAEGFVATVFEIPAEFPNFTVGQEVGVAEADVLDWMVNDAGFLRGGFSLRYQRACMPEERRAWFDEYIGVQRYSSLGLSAKEGTAGSYREVVAAPPADPGDVAGNRMDPIVALFIPALVALLANLEKSKGEPFSEAEVLAIRDNAACVAARRSVARSVAESRGYDDLDPENVWAEWQRVRAELAAEGAAE